MAVFKQRLAEALIDTHNVVKREKGPEFITLDILIRKADYGSEAMGNIAQSLGYISRLMGTETELPAFRIEVKILGIAIERARTVEVIDGEDSSRHLLKALRIMAEPANEEVYMELRDTARDSVDAGGKAALRCLMEVRSISNALRNGRFAEIAAPAKNGTEG